MRRTFTCWCGHQTTSTTDARQHHLTHQETR